MEVKDLAAGQGKIDLVVEIVSVDEPRTFEKFGRAGKVANAKAKDATGEITMSLWNEQVDMIKPGMKVHIINGYVSEYKGEKQLSTGKFGRLEVVQ
ncbi:DNA-binding protein [Candidatus Woesearchaeota archaeon]|nr:DNA-binding protein [Candidatus Woesearchaeota archaeon]MBW3016434.1 DNA-binding protein [Candidatus Woesearchaeota archaeon]